MPLQAFSRAHLGTSLGSVIILYCLVLLVMILLSHLFVKYFDLVGFGGFALWLILKVFYLAATSL